MRPPRPFLTASWRHLVLLSYEADPAVLHPRLPPGVELDLWEGRALVSVVGFMFLGTRVLGVPLPLLQRFEEVNLRFYVRRRGPEGWRHGVVFVKEIVPVWPITWGARGLFDEPYTTMPMRHELALDGAAFREGGRLTYEWRSGGRWNRLSARAVRPLGPPVAGTLPAFVVERYWGYTRRRDGSTSEYRVGHAPWTLWEAGEAALDAGADVDADLSGFLRAAPASVVLAEGSPVTVSRGLRLD